MGAALVEFTLVFPVFMLVAFGTVDVVYMLSLDPGKQGSL